MSETQTTTLVERLEDVGCDRVPFTDDHKHCICRLTNEAAREITKLTSQLEEARRKAIEDAAQKVEQFYIAPKPTSRAAQFHERNVRAILAAEVRALLSESNS